MYSNTMPTHAAGLGFSLKPPQWLRNLGAKILSETHVSVPTPAGPVTVNLNDPAQLNAVKQAVTGAKIQIGGKAPTPGAGQRILDLTGEIPGGSSTLLIGAGVAALALVFFMTRRPRSNPRRSRRSRRRRR